jgi:hypothetical protein
MPDDQEILDARVSHVIFNETHQVEIRFSDGREVIWTGAMAAELRATVQAAVKRGFDRRRRGMSGPNTAAN